MFRKALGGEKEAKLGIGSKDLEKSSRAGRMAGEHLRTTGTRGGEEVSGFCY